MLKGKVPVKPLKIINLKKLSIMKETIYDFLCSGDRRTSLYKELSNKYESLCKKDGDRFMETVEAKEFANMKLESYKKQ